MNKILLIGPCFSQKEEYIVGGTITLFEDLIMSLKEFDVKINVIDSNKKNYKNIIMAYFSIFSQISTSCRDCDVISLHSSKDYFILMPYILLIGKIFKKKISLRHFGMPNRINSKKLNPIVLIENWIFSGVDSLFFETKNLVNYFLQMNVNIFWFPNVRSSKLTPILPRRFNKRFIFLGRIIEEKGIEEILKVSLDLDEEYIIDIYGPLLNKKYTTEYFENYNVRYLGILHSEDVLSVLNQYDVLLLPTYYEGEGYPGVIIEAYSLGMPVISTYWHDITEIVESEKTGILVNPQNTCELIQAIEFFDDENYEKMSQNAYVKFNEFKSDTQTKLFLERVLDLYTRG